MIETTRSVISVSDRRLYVAFELGLKQWKLAVTVAPGIKPWVKTVPAGDLAAVREVVGRAKARWGLSSAAAVVSCYEAGRDGHWIHRALTMLGMANRVVDSSSIEVNRRARRSKTDHLDAVKLVAMLMRVCGGEVGVWREVRVPSVAEEAQRHVSRERQQLVQDTTRLMNQLRSLLATVGSRVPAQRQGAWWTRVRDWGGAALPASLQQRLAHAQARLTLLEAQIADLAQQQRTVVAGAAAATGLARLVQLKGIATTSASVLVDEGLLWRAFRNRREVGGLLGFRPVPHQSGAAARDVGIDRAGNQRWRSMMVQLAWGWIRWQPLSALTQWYQRRFADGGSRARRIGIVALARKLFIALWRYATAGVVPEGAILKVA